MPILDYDNGLTADEQTSRLLYFCAVDEADNFIASLSAGQQRWLSDTGFTARAGNTALLPGEGGGLDAALSITSDSVIWQSAATADALPEGSWKPICVSGQSLAAIQLGWGLAQYRFAPHKPKRQKRALLCLSPTEQNTVAQAELLGTHICRELINQPANIMTPAALADAACDIAAHFGADVKVVSGKALPAYAPALHIVGRAAESEPRMVDMRWGSDGPAITLVGKGITFDSGGLDIKPSKGMEIMKKDMGGAAHVLGLAAAIMAAGLKVRLRVLVAAAENAISEKSMRPLDSIATAAGIMVEVGNTDAEGRLVLADALHHALTDDDAPHPDFLIDFATLTGAARVAMGTECPALFCNHQETATALMRAGEALHDPIWQLPLFESYDRFLDTGQAGLSSTGSGGGYGGAITAALFLRRFTGRDVNWAHVDVMAWNISSRAGRPKGGEAMGLRATFQHISELAETNS